MRTYIALFLLFFMLHAGVSQNTDLSVFTTGGGNFANALMQQSFTIGEPITETFSGSMMVFTQGYQQSDLMRSLMGQVTYDNAVHSVMDNTNVSLKSGASTVYQVITNYAGYYLFKSLRNGSYELSAQSSKPWGGCNAMDALLIMKHFTGLTTLSGIRLAAADPNASGNVNTVDALHVARRFVGLQTSFALGDWVFEKHPVTVTGFTNLTDNFKGLCTGDVNGTHDPHNMKTQPAMALNLSNVMTLMSGEEVMVPVCVSEEIDLAALSLVLYYPEEQMVIKNVMASRDNQNLVFYANKGELRISWFSLNPFVYAKGDTLLNLQLQCHWDIEQGEQALRFTLGAESEPGDFAGNVIYNKAIEIPVIIKDESGFYLGQNMPNPVTAATAIGFSLPEQGFVRLLLSNILGQEIEVLLEGQYEGGSHTFRLDCSHIPAGAYTYTMQYTASGREFKSSRRMVVVH